MRERPIILNSEMVKAVLDGRKTQTRIMIKNQPGECNHIHWPENPEPEFVSDDNGFHCSVCGNGMSLAQNGVRGLICPFGKVGERLWVKETFADVNTENGPAFTYRADEGLKFCVDDEYPVNYDRYPGKNFAMWCGDLWSGEDGHIWTPSTKMPRWASRITLGITDVRVKRLQDISEEDAIAEGCINSLHLQGGRFANENFAWLWQSIYGDESWKTNPWVWVITFRMVV